MTVVFIVPRMVGPIPSIARMSREEYLEHLRRTGLAPQSKYKAKRTVVGDVKFASAAEGRRYAELKLLADKGEIHNLKLQPRYDLTVNGKKVATYVGDFEYVRNGQIVIEDVKGVQTPVYKLKKRIFEAVYAGLTITEVSKPRGNRNARTGKAKRGDVA